jgi:hypothetical protein
LAIFYLLGSPERASIFTAMAVTVVPSAMVGLIGGGAVALIARSIPFKAWGVFFVSSVVGVLFSLVLVGASDVLPELAKSAGTWAFVVGTAVLPAVAQVIRKRGV